MRNPRDALRAGGPLGALASSGAWPIPLYRRGPRNTAISVCFTGVGRWKLNDGGNLHIMNRSTAWFAVAVFLAAGGLPAQDANPVSANLKQSWNSVKGLLQRTAEKMPDENYSFKPMPEMQSFAQRLGHVIAFNMRGCSTVQGEVLNMQIAPTASKAQILAAMKQADDACDAVFNSLTDAEAAQTVNAGRGGQRQKLAVLEGLVLEHSQEVYGYLAVYLRLKGIVPPSSDRNER